MHTIFRLADYTECPGQPIIELWWCDQFIGQITPADGPGIRFVTKHKLEATRHGSLEMVITCKFATDPSDFL